MNFVLMFLLVITQQCATNATGESLSQLVHLHHYAETQLNQVKTIFATLMENAAQQQKKFSNELRRETSALIDEELKKLESSAIDDSETIKNKISNCAVVANEVIELSINKFVDLLDDAERMTYTAEDNLRIEPSSDDIDEINDEIDDIIDDFKEQFEETMIPRIDEILGQIKVKLVSLQSDLRRCFDEALN